MTLPRLHLIELEDLPWFPRVLRDLATDYLRFVQARLALHEPIVPVLREALLETKCADVIDLGSGAGGPIVGLQVALASVGVPVRFTLTDRYPNLLAVRARESAGAPDALTFVAESVDARAVPARLRGFRTLFNAFHHFAPPDAIAVLRDAAAARQPIGVFELPERSVRALVLFLLLTPLAVALTTPLVRPFRWRRLLFTYVLPFVPLTCWWDGIVSHLRAYTAEELDELAASVGADRYTWRVGRVRIPRTPRYVTYLLGLPDRFTESRPPTTSEPRGML